MERILDATRVQSIVVAIPGVGTKSPVDWCDKSGRTWLSFVSSNHTQTVTAFAFNHGLDAKHLSWRALVNHGEVLLDELKKLEKMYSKTPIIVVSHSVGGFIVKKALRLAFEQRSRHRRLLRSLAALIFLGVPHCIDENSPFWENVVYAIQQGSVSKAKDLLDSKDRSLLAQVCLKFEQAAASVPVVSIYETQPTKVRTSLLTSTKIKITPDSFVRIGSKHEKLIAMDSDHKDLCVMELGIQSLVEVRTFIIDVMEDTRLMIVQGTPEYDVPPALDAALNDIRARDTGSDAQNVSKGSGTSSDPFATAGSSAAVVESISVVSDFSTSLKDPHLPCFVVPISRNTKFFGQQDLLKRLDDSFFPSITDTPLVDSPEGLRQFALCGPGGIGKTQVAAEYVHTRRSRFDAIFWIYADQNLKIADAFATIAITLGLVQEDSSDARDLVVVREVVKGWLANPVKSYETQEKANWLMVFDNVDSSEVIGDYWPLDGPGSVLLTTRDPLGPAWISRIPVEPFTTEDAAEFLSKLTDRENDSEEEETRLEVAKRLGGIPLAISQMAGIIWRRDLSFDEFLSIYDEKESQEELFGLNLEGTLRRNSDYGHTLASVWSLESLKHGRAMLDVLALLDPDGITERILTSLPQSMSASGDVPLLHDYPRSIAEYQRARTELLQSSLISRDRSAQRVRVHRLVQDVVKAKMGSTRARFVFATCIRLLSHVWPFEAFGWRHGIARWAICEDLLPHVLMIFKAAKNHTLQQDMEIDYKLAALFTDAGWYYHECGFSLEALPLFEQAQSICDSLFQAMEIEYQDTETTLLLRQAKSLAAEIHHNIGCVATETNQPSVALYHFTHFNRLVTDEVKANRDDEALNKKHAISLNELGIAYMMNKRWKDAEKCFLEAISIMKTVDASATELRSLPMANLGLAYWSLGGRLEEADKVLMTGLADREAKYGVDDRESFITGRLLHAIGNVKADLAKVKADENLLDESRAYHQRALAHYKATIGKNHHRTADTCVKVADHCIRLGKLDDATKLLDQAMKIYGERDIYKPERARAAFKRSKVRMLVGKNIEAQKDRQASRKLLQEITGMRLKPADELSDSDFDEEIVFWSK